MESLKAPLVQAQTISSGSLRHKCPCKIKRREKIKKNHYKVETRADSKTTGAALRSNNNVIFFEIE